MLRAAQSAPSPLRQSLPAESANRNPLPQTGLRADTADHAATRRSGSHSPCSEAPPEPQRRRAPSSANRSNASPHPPKAVSSVAPSGTIVSNNDSGHEPPPLSCGSPRMHRNLVDEGHEDRTASNSTADAREPVDRATKAALQAHDGQRTCLACRSESDGAGLYGECS